MYTDIFRIHSILFAFFSFKLQKKKKQRTKKSTNGEVSPFHCARIIGKIRFKLSYGYVITRADFQFVVLLLFCCLKIYGLWFCIINCFYKICFNNVHAYIRKCFVSDLHTFMCYIVKWDDDMHNDTILQNIVYLKRKKSDKWIK